MVYSIPNDASIKSTIIQLDGKNGYPFTLGIPINVIHIEDPNIDGPEFVELWYQNGTYYIFAYMLDTHEVLARKCIVYYY